MLGGIYSNDKCSVCRKRLRDNRKDAVSCPDHPEIRARKLQVQFRGVWKRFTNYEQAQKFLYGLRFETDRGRFDRRDYATDNPLGFTTLALAFLDAKRHCRAVKDYRARLKKAMEVWEDRNIKEISAIDLSKFANQLVDKHSSYYAHLIVGLLSSLWRWCFEMGYLRQGIDPMPRFPRVKWEMKFRKIVDQSTQEAILGKIQGQTWKDNPRIFLAINMLRTYLHVRPMELLSCNEGHLNLASGVLVVPTTKEKRTKLIRLLEEDIALLRDLPRSFPTMPLFRYDKGTGGQPPRRRFGHHVLAAAWQRACDALGVKGVPLYPGTRHSSANSLGDFHSPEEVKAVTGHHTSKAFERYFRLPEGRVKNLYAEIRGDKKVTKVFSLDEKRK